MGAHQIGAFIFCLFSLAEIISGQIRSEYYTDWTPKEIYRFFNEESSSYETSYKPPTNEHKLSFSFWMKTLDGVTGQIFEAKSSQMEFKITVGVNVVFSFQIPGYSMDCPAPIAPTIANFQTDEWVFIFQGVSFPRWEGFGYIRDVNKVFTQTVNGSCNFPDTYPSPDTPETTIISSNININIKVMTTSKLLIYYSDYYPSSFFPLSTDFVPFGAHVLFRYNLIPFLENKLWDTSMKQSMLTIDRRNKDREGLRIESNYFKIEDIKKEYGLSFIFSSWLKISPKESNPEFKIFTITNQAGSVLFEMDILDLKKLGEPRIKPSAFQRSIPLNKWFHMVVHSFSDTLEMTWLHISLYIESEGIDFPQRNYEKVEYAEVFKLEDDYTLTIGDPNYDPSRQRKYTFLMDDITFIQGGTIQTSVSKAVENGNCVTKAGFQDLNPSANISEYVCLLCDRGYYALGGECISSTECKYIDEDKRLCKDVQLNSLPDKPRMDIEYVQGLINGHQIKIILSPVIFPNENNTFVYSIAGLEYESDFDASVKHPKENIHTYIVNITFEEDVDREMELKVDLVEEKFVILTGSIVLPAVDVVSEEFVKGVGTGTTVFIGTVLGVAVASTVPMILTGRISLFWGLLDILQIVSLMMYINAPYPVHVETFFDKMTVAQLDFLPNYIDDITQLILESLGHFGNIEITDQEAPFRFDLKGKTSSFLENGGSLLSFQLLLVMISAGFTLLRKITAPNFKKLSDFIRKIEKLMDINYFIRGFHSVALPLSMAVQLQWINISGNDAINIISATICFIGFIYMVIVTYYIFRISVTVRKEVKDKDIKQVVAKFSSVFEGFFPKEKWGAYYSFLMFMKKYILVYFLVFFQPVPELQITCLTILYIVNTYVLKVFRVYRERRQLIVAKWSEILLLLAHLCVCTYIYRIATGNSPRYIIGWIIIILIVATIILNMTLIIYEQILSFREVKVQFRKLWIRIKNICRTKQPYKIKRTSKFSGSSLKQKRVNRLNPEEVKGFGITIEMPVLAKQLSKEKEGAKSGIFRSGDSLKSKTSQKDLPKVVKRIKKSKTNQTVDKNNTLRMSGGSDDLNDRESPEDIKTLTSIKLDSQASVVEGNRKTSPLRTRRILRPKNTLSIVNKKEKNENRIILPPE